MEDKQNSIQEYYVGNNRFFLASDYVIYIEIVGEIDDETAIQCKEVVEKLHALFEGEIRVLVDLNKAGKQSSKARRVWNEYTEQGDRKVKIAIWGLHQVARILASFFIGITGNRKCKFFSDRNNAMNWLNEK